MKRNSQHAARLVMMMAVFALALSGFAGRASAAPFDQAFIDAMVPHHQSALMMANMAVKKAHYNEVRTLARGIISDQQKEIKQMKAWRKAWFGSAEPSKPMMGDKMMMSGKMMSLPMKMEMGQLKKATGREFDKMFLMMMIPHHSSAITMADEALKVTGRKEIRNMAHNIIAVQAREIGKMQGILDRRF